MVDMRALDEVFFHEDHRLCQDIPYGGRSALPLIRIKFPPPEILVGDEPRFLFVLSY